MSIQSSLQPPSSETFSNDKSISMTDIKVGDHPWAVAVNNKKNITYVLRDFSYTSRTLSVINDTRNSIIQNIPLFYDANYLAVNPNTNIVYVTGGEDSGEVAVINGTTNKIVRNYTVGDYHSGVAVNPNTNTAYVITGNIEGNNTLSIINGTTNNIMNNISLNPSASGITVAPQNNMIYVLFDPFSDTVAKVGVINGTTNEVLKYITIPPHPTDIDINPLTGLVYVVNEDGNRVTVIDSKTNDIVKRIVGNYSSDIYRSSGIASSDFFGRDFTAKRSRIAIDPTTSMVYVTKLIGFNEKTTSRVIIINGTTNSLIKTFRSNQSMSDIAINPVTNTIYVTDSNSDTLSLIDGSIDNVLKWDNNEDQESQLDHVDSGFKVGRQPIDLAVNRDTNKIYVIYDRSDKISVIDGGTDMIIDTIRSGGLPSDIAINPVTNTIYVTDSNSETVYVIDGETNSVVKNVTVGTLPIPSEEFGQVRDYPIRVAVNPDTNMIYVISFNDMLSVIDGSTNTLLGNATISNYGTYPPGIAIDTTMNKIYLASDIAMGIGIESYDRVTAIKGLEEGTPEFFHFSVIDNITIPGFSNDIAVNPNTNIVYTVSGLYDEVSQIDGYTYIVIDNITLAGEINALAVIPDTNMIYVTNRHFDLVYVIDGETNSVVKNVTVGRSPYGIDVNQNTNMIYVTNLGSDTVSVINGDTSNLTARVTFNINPPNSGEIYCLGQKVSNYTIRLDVDTICEAKANSGFIFSSWFDNQTNSKTPFKVSRYGPVTANFIRPLEEYGNTISFIALASFIILPTLFSARPSILTNISSKLFSKITKNLPKLNEKLDILGIDVTVITGVLIFLSLEGFEESEQTQISFITANMVFPFAGSAIVTLINLKEFGRDLR